MENGRKANRDPLGAPPSALSGQWVQSNPVAPREVAPGLIQVEPGSHSVSVAILASIVATGFGQLYNKQMGKGTLIISLGILLVLGFIARAFSDWVSALGILVLGALLLITLATLDAARIAGKLNRGEVVRPWQWFLIVNGSISGRVC